MVRDDGPRSRSRLNLGRMKGGSVFFQRKQYSSEWLPNSNVPFKAFK